MFLLAASMGILMTDHGIPSNQPETNPRCPGFGNCSCQTRLTQKPQIPLRPPWSLRATKAGSNIGFLVPCSLHSTQQHPTSTLHRGGGAPQRFQEDFPAGHSPSSLLDPGLDILVIYLEHFRKIVSGWWYTYPSEKYESHLGWLFPIYGTIWKNKSHVPNHQPGIIQRCTRHWRKKNTQPQYDPYRSWISQDADLPDCQGPGR